MVFCPKDKTKIVSNSFPCFTLFQKQLQFVTEFWYLGHCLLDRLNDEVDIKHKIHNAFQCHLI